MRGWVTLVRELEGLWGLRQRDLYEGYEIPSCIGFPR